jgi:hypothetical protein
MLLHSVKETKPNSSIPVVWGEGRKARPKKKEEEAPPQQCIDLNIIGEWRRIR